MANKFYKNPQRGNVRKFKPYVPQYVIRGLEPEAIASAMIPETFERAQTTRHAPVKVYDNPRTRPASMMGSSNVPFAEIPKGPSPIGLGPLPNVGNNVENTWAYVDGEVFDDISGEAMSVEDMDPDHEIIDNNEDDPNNYVNIPRHIPNPPGQQMSNKKTQRNRRVQLEETNSKSTSISDYEYVLLVHGDVISTGFKEEIEEEVTALVYGEHYLCNETVITPDDITVLKKIKIKIGVFIDI